MYLNEPVDPKTGKRPFHYIGVDPDKLQAARDKIDRYHLRQQVRTELAELRQEYRYLQQQLDDILDHAKVVASHSTKAFKDFDRGYKSSVPASC